MDTHLLAKRLVLSEESYHVLPRLRVWEGVKPESRDRPALQAQGFASSSSCAVTGSPVASAPAEMKQGVLAVNDLEVSERIIYIAQVHIKI